ncbi:9432_t:CDS:2, partial [Gigaspora margarita]
MFKLLNNSEDKYSEKTVSGLFGDSFFCLGKEHLSGQIKHHPRFSIEYLIRENILDQEGTPIDLSGIITHLYYTEPSNFAMAALFKHDVFHEVCSEVTSNPTKMMDGLVLILSHLFNEKNYIEILEEHNEHNCLPLSKFEFLPKQLDDNIQEWNLIEKLNSMSIPFSARSPFIAMCGSVGDEFINIEDLCEHIHHKIYLDLHSIPYIKIEKALDKANGIRPGEVWQCLKDFDFILQTIITSLTVRKIESEENVLKGFKMVSESFRE